MHGHTSPLMFDPAAAQASLRQPSDTHPELTRELGIHHGAQQAAGWLADNTPNIHLAPPHLTYMATASTTHGSAQDRSAQDGGPR